MSDTQATTAQELGEKPALAAFAYIRSIASPGGRPRTAANRVAHPLHHPLCIQLQRGALNK
jgi:hypothetical protein